ncbi:MAG: hypothetical protein AAB074_23275 [Planctomycetota bacterium]
MRAREADARLEMIRSLMQRGERWPGLSAGACFAAAGCAVLTAWWCEKRGLAFRADMVPDPAAPFRSTPYMVSAVPYWTTLAVACFIGFVTATAAGAARRGERPLSRQTWAALLSIAPSLFVGTFLTPVVPYAVLPATWMLCYGTGVCSLGWFAGFPATVSGLLFLVAGALSLFTGLKHHPNAMMAASFGGLHALLGTLLLLQSRKPDDDHVHFDPVEDR